MRIVLVGADIEENLGLCMLNAVASLAGHHVEVVAFNEPGAASLVVSRALALGPEVIGLSLQFQHRAAEFLGLARSLRAEGFTGHLTCGGQLPSMAWRELLEDGWGLDSIVLHEGEETFVELLGALASGAPVAEVAGLATLDETGRARLTAPRAPLGDLDALPGARRYRPHSIQLGVPFIPMTGSRGCWGRCTFCAITSTSREARLRAGGPKVSRRSPEAIAEEMAVLAREAGAVGVYCFHDDTFTLPKPADTLERLQRLRAALDARGLEKAALVGKCRPDTVTPELLRQMAELGVIRLYVGVENASQAGADHLGRKVKIERMHQALKGCQAAGIFVCYNLLVFEPETTLAHLRENIAFIRAHDQSPVNFCRAEPYHGTPLQHRLAEEGNLRGSYLGYNYRIADDRAEQLFRVCSTAFRQRNFDAQGVANRSMGLGYAMKILEHFHDDPDGRHPRLRQRCLEVTRGITTETADLLEEAIGLVEVFSHDAERLTRETALLGLRIAAADAVQHARLDDVYGDLNLAAAAQAQRSRRRWIDSARQAVLTASLAMSAAACDGCYRHVVDPPPPDPVPVDIYHDGQVLPPDPVPRDLQPQVVDPPPPDVQHVQPQVVDPPPPDVQHIQPIVVDPVPPPEAVPLPPDPLPRPMPPPDPVPNDPPPIVDPVPPPSPHRKSEKPSARLLSASFRDSGARAVVRTTDLPLFAPPRLSLEAHREGELIRVEALIPGIDEGDESLRWEGDGEIQGRGRRVTWRPTGPNDQLRLALRTTGGVSIASLRAVDL